MSPHSLLIRCTIPERKSTQLRCVFRGRELKLVGFCNKRTRLLRDSVSRHTAIATYRPQVFFRYDDRVPLTSMLSNIATRQFMIQRSPRDCGSGQDLQAAEQDGESMTVYGGVPQK